MDNYTLTDEDKYRINMMFEMMQVPILKYMVYLIEQSEYHSLFDYNKIFNLPPLSELNEMPMILQNIEGFDDKYIHISFEIEDLNEMNTINYKSFITDESILEYITSLVNNGANMIWDYFLNEKIIDKDINHYLRKIKLSLDTESLIFLPTVCSPTQQVIDTLRQVLQSINDYKNKVDENTGLIMYNMLSEDKQDEIHVSESKLIEDIHKLETNLSENEIDECFIIEEKLKKIKHLVAKCSVVEKSKLPNNMQQVLTNYTIAEE
jgi:hypothetical protein